MVIVSYFWSLDGVVPAHLGISFEENPILILSIAVDF
jgi:hypothetical protein